MRFLAALILVSALFASQARAQLLWEEEFSNDEDPASDFEPNTRSPITEPDYGGLPPIDWRDFRTGFNDGVIEENLSTVGDVGYPVPDPGADTPEFGVMHFYFGRPVWVPSNSLGDWLTVCFNVDVYADPLIEPGDDWAFSGEFFGSAFGIASMACRSNAGGTWTFSDGNIPPIATLPVGLWYELEICVTQGADGTLDAISTVYDATHTVALGTSTRTSVLGLPANGLIRPADVFFQAGSTSNGNVLFIDDFRVSSPVPEPSSFALAALGVIGLALRKRVLR